MALRKIMTSDEKTLYKTSRPVTKFDRRLHKLLDDMAETLDNANGAGLAAPQVGILRRVFIVDLSEEGPIEFINPEILDYSGEQDGLEGCLSLPGKWGMVKRPNYVRVRAQDRYGEWFEIEGEELMARCILHENDHLDGHLYSEKVYRWVTQDELEEMYEEDEES